MDQTPTAPSRRPLGTGGDGPVPPTAPDEQAAFARHVAFVNATRLRVLFALLAVIDAALAVLWLAGQPVFVPAGELAAAQRALGTYFPALIFAQLALSIGYLLGLRRPRSPDAVPRWRGTVDRCVMLAVMGNFALRTALRAALTGATEVYAMAAIGAGVFVLLSVRWRLALYAAALALLLGCDALIHSPLPFGLALNLVIATVVGFAVGELTYRRERRDFLRQRQLAATTEQVRASELRHRQLVDNSPVGIYRTSVEGTVLDANPALLRILEFDSIAALNRHGLTNLYLDPEDRKRLWGLARQQPSVSGFETRFRLASGRIIPVAIGAHVVQTAAGEPVHLEGTLEDISTRRKAEEALRESERRLADIIAFLPDAVVVIDREGRVIAWNRAIEELTGVAASAMLGKGDHEYAVPFYGERRPILVDLVLLPDDVLRDQYANLKREGAILSGEAYTPSLPGGGRYLYATAAALRDARGQVVGAIELVRDITDRKRDEEALLRAKGAAEAANEAKSAFLAMMSHEIRTPMNAIIGMSGLLLDTQLTAEQREFADTIRGSGDALLAIINDILDFSKVEAGKLALEEQPFDLVECVESSLELLKLRAIEKGLELASSIDPGVPGAVRGDVTRLRQILINLIGNAIKFTERGEVVVTVARATVPAAAGAGPARLALHFAVRDTGVGIAPDRRDRLFQAFTQVDDSTTRRYGGTGLGLAISRRLAELMGGTMWVESEAGVGSTFHFTISVTPADELVRRPASTATMSALAGRRLLIVDDNPTNRTLLSRQVERWQMVTRTSASPGEALGWIERGEAFDLALLDLQMPEMDGVALGAEIRRRRAAAALPLVLLSSSSGPSPAPPDLFAAFVPKPVRQSTLFDVLMSLLVRARPASSAPGPADAPLLDPGMGARHPLRVLIAEDNAVNQKLALRLLERLGYRADVAANGLEAIDAVARQPYDVVLMDVQMPEMDGLMASRTICARWPAGTRPRIIAMTADAMQGDRERCLDAGMDDYVSKPIRVEALVEALERARARQDA